MKFFDQLKLLVWKNFTLRKRQHIRNVVEIVWPLVLFIILVAVRNRQNYGATNEPASIYRPRALPSAGLFPFVRSFLCDFKSTETSDPSEILNGLPDLRSSSLGRLLEDGLPLLTNDSLRKRLLRISEDSRRFRTDLNRWNDFMNNSNNSSRPVQWNGYTLSAVPLDKLLKEPAQFQEFLYKTAKLSPRVVAELFNSTVNVQKIARLVEPYRSLSQESLSWLPRNPLEIGNLPLPSSSNNQQVNLFWSLLLMRIASTMQSQGTISGSEVRFIICDSRSPVNLQEILNGPGNVTEVKTALCKLNNTVLGELGKELQTQIKWPNITDYQGHQRNLSKLLRSLQGDIRNLNEDVQALQAFQQVTEDYLGVMQDLQAGGFQATLCGRNLRDDDDEDNQNNGNGGTSNRVLPGLLAGLCGYSRYPNGTFYKPAGSHPLDYYLNLTQNTSWFWDDSEEEKDGKETHKDENCPGLVVEYSKYNVTGRQDTCSIIHPDSRVDCGWPGVSEDQCVQMGCCFDSSIPNTRFCFYKAGKVFLSEVIGMCLQSKFLAMATLRR